MRDIENICLPTQIIPLRQKGFAQFQNIEDRDKKLNEIEAKIKSEVNKKLGYFTSSAKRSEIEKEVRESFQISKA